MGERGQTCGLLVLSVLSLSFLPSCAAKRPVSALPIRIGLLGDSQITSPNSTPECPYRNKYVDKQLGCAIRPPAIEHLAPEILQCALGQFPSDIDVILYLGDGANSGGEDEIDALFTALGSYRERSRVPIFVVIGNHDYLGVGNTTDPLARFLLLNRLQLGETPALPTTINRSLSKYEVLRRIADFNHASSAMPENTLFRYTDNQDTLDPNLDHGSGLYLAGRLVYPKDGDKTVEIFLADSSDYVDVSFKPELVKLSPFIPQWDFYGMQGSVSTRDRETATGGKRPSQITYLRDDAAGLPPDFRFVASHYPPDNLDRKRTDIPMTWHFELWNTFHGTWETIETLFFGSVYANQRIDSWRIDSRRNYWLSAHTHRTSMTCPGQGCAHVGGVGGLLTGAAFHNINVGSATDYRAHITVVEPYSRQQAKNNHRIRRIDRYVQFREIPLLDLKEPREEQHLRRLLADIEAYGRENRNTTHCIEYESDAQFGMSLLGLNKDYQNRRWTAADTEATCQRLDRFIDAFVSGYPDDKRADVVRCLAFIAGASEAGACGGEKGFDPDRCRPR